MTQVSYKEIKSFGGDAVDYVLVNVILKELKKKAK